MVLSISILCGALTAALVAHADLRRRRLALTRLAGWRLLTGLDIAATAATMGFGTASLVELIPVALSEGIVPLGSSATWGVFVGAVTFLFLWGEGRRQIQFQRPRGIVFAEWLLIAATNLLFVGHSLGHFLGAPGSRWIDVVCVLAAIAGATLIVAVVSPFVRKGAEYHRILDHLVEEGESVQKEYTAPTPECPNPELWSMVDSQTTELEVLDFLKSLVITTKPRLIVETGTFLGYGTIKLAEGAKTNGFGKVITVEYDPAIFAKARERIRSAGLADWVECRNESSLDTQIDGMIDLYFSDSALAIREQEIRRLLPQVDRRGVIAIHDASSHFEVVRQAALLMEREGLLSVVLLSTPRGLVIAQPRDGRR